MKASTSRPGMCPCLLVSAVVGWSSASVEAQAGPEPAADANVVSEYTIASGDTLQVFVWKEPELSREMIVRRDGRITVPLLGDVEAGGRTPQDLSRDLAERLSRFIEAPVVSVAVSQASSLRVFVIGHVRTPGAVPLSSRMTLLQALALAGGFLEFAKTEKILVVREGPRGSSSIPVNYKKIEGGEDLDQNIVLKPGDTVVVP